MGADEVPDIDSDQRIDLVKSEIRDKLGGVDLWLREHNIGTSVMEIDFFREGKAALLHPHLIGPLPVGSLTETGVGNVRWGTQPWATDGRSWQLNKRFSPETRETLPEFGGLQQANFDVDSPRWNQEFYVAYRVRNNIWPAH